MYRRGWSVTPELAQNDKEDNSRHANLRGVRPFQFPQVLKQVLFPPWIKMASNERFGATWRIKIYPRPGKSFFREKAQNFGRKNELKSFITIIITPVSGKCASWHIYNIHCSQHGGQYSWIYILIYAISLEKPPGVQIRLN